MRRCTYLLMAVVVACTALSSKALKVPATDEKIILTTASGEEKIVTRAEMEAMEAQQRQLHAQVLERVEGEWVEDESLADVARRDPSLARSIAVARDSFAVLQKHGYAQGYALSSFTEVDTTTITSRKAQQEPDFNGKIELRITLQLTATIDPSSGVPPNPGTSAAKRSVEPETLQYEVEVLYDKNEIASVVYAWELTKNGRRGKTLRISPSEALQKRYQERQQSSGPQFTTWLLAGGVTLIVAGAAVLVLTPRRAPVEPKVEPPVTSPKHSNTDGRKRKDAKSVLAREASDKWELANGR